MPTQSFHVKELLLRTSKTKHNWDRVSSTSELVWRIAQSSHEHFIRRQLVIVLPFIRVFVFHRQKSLLFLLASTVSIILRFGKLKCRLSIRIDPHCWLPVWRFFFVSLLGDQNSNLVDVMQEHLTILAQGNFFIASSQGHMTKEHAMFSVIQSLLSLSWTFDCEQWSWNDFKICAKVSITFLWFGLRRTCGTQPQALTCTRRKAFRKSFHFKLFLSVLSQLYQSFLWTFRESRERKNFRRKNFYILTSKKMLLYLTELNSILEWDFLSFQEKTIKMRLTRDWFNENRIDFYLECGSETELPQQATRKCWKIDLWLAVFYNFICVHI